MTDQENTNKAKDNTHKYNIIMPESDDRVLCVRVDKPVSPEGYSENFLPRLRAMIQAHGGIRLLIDFHEYHGWEAEAALMNMAGMADFGRLVVKIAYVNPPKREMIRAKAAADIISGEMRFFDTDQLDEALRWVRA